MSQIAPACTAWLIPLLVFGGLAFLAWSLEIFIWLTTPPSERNNNDQP